MSVFFFLETSADSAVDCSFGTRYDPLPDHYGKGRFMPLSVDFEVRVTFCPTRCDFTSMILS